MRTINIQKMSELKGGYDEVMYAGECARGYAIASLYLAWGNVWGCDYVLTQLWAGGCETTMSYAA